MLINAFLPLHQTIQAATEGEYRFVAKWGPPDLTRDGNVQNPTGIAVDTAGLVYVADRGNNRVQKFTSAGNLISKWGSQGSGNGQFSAPSGIAVDTARNVYVSDSGNHRIQKFSSSGEFILAWGSKGSGDGQFSYPGGIAVDTGGNVYVADTYNYRIQKFTSSGIFITKWGEYDRWVPMEGTFQYPRGVAIDTNNYVYVTDYGNHAIQKLSSSGTYMWEWYGEGDGHLQGPWGIATDTAGNVYVGEGSRIQKFTSSGIFITKWGSYGSGDGQLACISGIAADSLGYVYVTDSCNHRIQKFSPSGTFIAKWGAQGEGNGYFSENGPNNIAVDAEGNVYVTDTSAWTVQKFAPGTATAAGNSLYFPHVDTNLPWQTEVAIINTSDQTVTGTLRALSNAGQLMESKAITLPAHGRKQITVANEFSNSTNIGYLIFDTSSDTVQGYTKFYQAGVYRVAIPAVKEVNSGDIFITHIDQSNLWWTGISLVNTTSAQKDMTITFNTGQSVSYTLKAGEHKAFTIASRFNNQPQPNIKSAVISNAAGVIGLELFGSSSGG